MYLVEEFDKNKTKVLKYILYKKRTEKEVRQKFENEIEENQFEDIIEYLKGNNYIDDESYIKRAINEFIALKNLSIKEIKNKLYQKGVSNNLIENYIEKNSELMYNYERRSIQNIINKKKNGMQMDEIKIFLFKRGYTNDNINEVIDEI